MTDEPVGKLGIFGIAQTGDLGPTFQEATGAAEGISAADAPATGLSSTVTGSSTGTSVTTGIGGPLFKVTGTSTGSATSVATAAARTQTTGSSNGSTTANAPSSAFRSGTGEAEGSATSAASSNLIGNGVGSSNGVATVSGSMKSSTNAMGFATGEALAEGISTVDDNTSVGEAAGTSTATGSGAYSKTIRVTPAVVVINTNINSYSYRYSQSCSGDNVPLAHVEDSKKLDADAYVDLFEITLSDGVTKVYLKMNKTIVWQGHSYEGTGIKIDGVGSYADEQVARPKLTIFNPENVYSYLIDQGLIENARIVRIRVLKEHIDQDLPVARRQQWFVKRVVSVKSNFIGLELRDMLDGQNFLTPGRMFIPPEFKSVSLQ